jgi:hypothetical protein
MSLPLEPNAEATPTTVQYRALCPIAVASVALGGLSILTVFSWYLAAIPLVGIWLGWKALQKIRQAPNEWTGLGIARTGISLSVGLWTIGYGWLIFAQASEIPYGYQRVSYETLQPNPDIPTELIPQSAHDMQDKRVYVRGFMQPRRQQTGIKEFILVPANGECPFCIPNPKRTEMIRVFLQGDLETIYTTHQIGVGGRFQVDPADPSGIPYGIDADFLH